MNKLYFSKGTLIRLYIMLFITFSYSFLTSDEKGKVLNTDGRVGENVYVVGWAKRGPSGVIGTNKSDAADVMKLLVEDLGTPKNSGDVTEVITHNRVVTQQHWQAINEAEVAAGEPVGKPRRKSVAREDLLKHAGL